MSQYQPEDPIDRDLASDTRSPEEIEREIERTRERMSSNIDVLGEKLSPDHLKQQAKDAIVEKAQNIVADVGDQARETGTRVIDFIIENPLPVAAASLGAIWLFSLRRGNQRQVSGDRMARFAYTGPERREPGGAPGLGRRLADRAGALRDKVSDAASQAGERVGELKERAGELKERVQEQTSELGRAAGERTRQARSELERMMEENPLALVAGAAVLGLVLGMLLPETEPERRVMGGPRDQLAERVSNVASRAKDAAVEAGREVRETVRDEVENRAPELTNTLKDAAESVKDQIKESAGRVAQEAKREIRQNPSSGGTG
jgi:ElaB/YqjD/DUF883 family membrane-anchored ribosome-binding protein